MTVNPMGVDFYNKDNFSDMYQCPVCGHTGRWVMRCNKCGRVFCMSCKPENFKEDKEDYSEELTVICDNCGEHTYFA